MQLMAAFNKETGILEKLEPDTEKLSSFVERIEAAEREKQEVTLQIKEIKDEANAMGFDVKVLNDVLKIRKQDASKRTEHEALLAVYLQALGMEP